MNVYTLGTIMPRAPVAWLKELVLQMPIWSIDTPNEIASFIAQLAHESAEFTRLEENLNYSALRLTQVWPKRFPTLESAKPYANAPELLANKVYAGRLGNGDEASGDGWRYRGRGPIQITGKSHYDECGAGIDAPIVDEPSLLLDPRIGIRSACWFWRTNGLDLLDDDADIRVETRRVNGGDTGLADRQAYFQKALTALAAEVA